MTKGAQNKDSKIAYEHALKSIGKKRKCNGIFHKGYPGGEVVESSYFKRQGSGYQAFCSDCDQARQNIQKTLKRVSAVVMANNKFRINLPPEFKEQETIINNKIDLVVSINKNILDLYTKLVDGKEKLNIKELGLYKTDFAVDSSGFSTSQFDRWFDVRLGANSDKRRFRKCHITCGVKTNIITAINITRGFDADSPQFKDLVLDTKRVYDIKEVSADKAYSSRENLSTVSKIGGIAYIPFKKNITGKRRGEYLLWGRMYRYYLNHQEEFMQHYHKRSNVETCFHMLKTKFGKHLRSRDVNGQENEIMAKCLAHNLCVLTQELFELGIDVDFEKCANIEIAHKHN